MAARRSSTIATDAFGQLLAQASRFPRLDRQAELDLARRACAGERAAADALVCAHLRHVIAIAGQYRGYGLRASDLVEEGILGLLEAVRRFDPERNLRFMTYASHWVRAFMLGFVLKQSRMVSLGTGPVASRLFFRLGRERARLAREVPEDELAGALAASLGASEERVAEMTGRLATRDASLDAPRPNGGDAAIDHLVDERMGPEAAAAHTEHDARVRERLSGVWPALDERERIIVAERLLLGEDGASLADLGRRLGVSRERMRQLEVRVKAKLKVALRASWDEQAA